MSDGNTNKQKRGRKEGRIFDFGKGFELQGSHMQRLRIKLCILKLYQSPPPHRGKKPLLADEIKLRKWKQKANWFGTYMLVLFRPETNLYESGQINSYKYNWNAFQEFKHSLKSGNFFDTMRYRTMQGYMYGLEDKRKD